MNAYNCQATWIGSYLKVKMYGKPIYPGRMKPYRTMTKRQAEGINSNLHLKPESLDLGNSSRYNSIPQTRRLSLAERERFENLMDLNFAKGHKYITLTYGKEHVSLAEASKDFENWVKRMRERYGDFKYLAVRSFQGRGTIHFHILANLPRIPREELADGTFRSIWGHGNVDFKQVYELSAGDRRNKLKKYLLKNLQEFKADERSYGKRLFLQSKNLKLPEIFKGNYDELMEDFRKMGVELKLVESRQFPVDYLNYIRLETHQIIA
ncbi:MULTISPECIES: RNA replicase [unclassified Paenibacillus]|uniref:rolling circle replication-associated protein n=1 Tax=unclassified Paenibacillus TaxID=185978 RepID=UPI002405C700|nr:MULTISPECIES: RNA replicase [unclassified Paenibacillus]MDF9845508.1 hypothetical protein [Paenibacillus sp. PastF-2]MDF9852087.1 hypothetical protein [Paenibacillus sp. PastM-2]MDF9858681.1 hypothetical protein [Paenibacillus sp. PastF-1]MDH6483928.1 hypothetical protein [Paenibacillus sp. PastH-2]MDH6511303.1 hypothetical protein [Paenibacillus sp. PastM-3]